MQNELFQYISEMDPAQKRLFMEKYVKNMGGKDRRIPDGLQEFAQNPSPETMSILASSLHEDVKDPLNRIYGYILDALGD